MRQPWVDALLARCQALTAADSEAEPHYTRALTLHHPHNRPFERARTELVYGEWLRRSRRKTEARVHLRAAPRRLVAWSGPEGVRVELAAGGDAEFGVGLVQVVAHRPRAEEQLGGDVAVR